MKLRVVIAHVPGDAQRRAWVETILERTAAFEPIVVEDVNRDGCWPTAKRCYETAANFDCTHTLILADDMMPCLHFARVVPELIDAVPDHPITLFSMSSTVVTNALLRGDHWYINPVGVWSMSTILPQQCIREFVPWTDRHTQPYLKWEDSRLSLYLLHRLKKPVYVSVPSLLEHVGAMHSLLGHSNKAKVATAYLGDDDGSTIDWRFWRKPLRVSGSLQPATRAAYIP